MGKTKSTAGSITWLIIIIALTVIMSILTFVKFTWPFDNTKTYQGFLGAVELDGDLKGGVEYDLTLKDDISGTDETIDVTSVLQTLNNRLEALGYEGATVRAYRENENEEYAFSINMKLKSSTEEDIKVIAAYGELEFTDGDGNYIMGAEGVKNASYREADSSYYVIINFTTGGAKTLIDKANASTDFKLAIKLGNTTLLEASTFEASYISNNSLAVTSSSSDSAKQMVLEINSGGLKYEYEVSEGKTSDSYLGKGVLKNVFIAVLVVSLLAALALIVFYRGLGAIAALSVYVFSLFYIFMLILVPGVVLNLGGIIGMILSLALSFMCSLIIARNVKKEYAKGKTLLASVKTTYYQKSLTILDMQAAIGVFALIAYFLCTGFVKNFAVTLGIGVVLSLIFTIFFSWLLTNISVAIWKNSAEKFFNLKREAE